MNYNKILSKYSPININNKKIVLYTVIFGNYDQLKEIQSTESEIEYICFTNQNIKHSLWKIIFVDEKNLDNIILARLFKLNPHILFKDFSESIFIDGSIKIKKSMLEFKNKYFSKSKICFFKHPSRNCIFKEIMACIILNKDDKFKLLKLIKTYKKKKYPINNGLVSTGFIYRHHNDSDIIKLMDNWTHFILKFSIRDQVSFNYLSWLNKIDYDLINLNIFNNHFFKVNEHNSKKIKLLYKLKYLFYKILTNKV